jgi:hypothetical protein
MALLVHLPRGAWRQPTSRHLAEIKNRLVLGQISHAGAIGGLPFLLDGIEADLGIGDYVFHRYGAPHILAEGFGRLSTFKASACCRAECLTSYTGRNTTNGCSNMSDAFADAAGDFQRRLIGSTARPTVPATRPI